MSQKLPFAKCEECTLAPRPLVKGVGPEEADLIIVGEAPIQQDVLYGKPFSSQGGTLLFKCLEQVGIDRNLCYITNACMCHPESNEAPDYHQIQACRQRLLEEIKCHTPKIVVPLGNVAVASIFNQKKAAGITTLRGKLFESTELGTLIFPSYHPAAILRNPRLFADFANDLSKVKEHLGNAISGSVNKYVPTKYFLINNVYQALQTIDFLNKQPVIASDVETTDLDYRRGQIFAIGFTYKAGESIIFMHDILNHHLVRTALKKLLENPNIRWIWDNGKYDCKYIRHRWGIQARTDDDTMLKHYVIDERKGTHDLGIMASDYLGFPDYYKEFVTYLPLGGSYDKAPVPALCDYLSKDTDATFKLDPVFDRLMEQEGNVAKVYHKVLIPASELLMDVEMRGIAVDKEEQRKREEEYEVILERQSTDLTNIAHQAGWDSSTYQEASGAKKAPEEFNEGSPKQLGHVVFNLLGLPKYKNTTTTDKDAIKFWLNKLGCPSETAYEDKPDEYEAVLNEWMATDIRNKFVYTLSKYRKTAKLFSTYIVGVREAIADDGRIHCSFLIHGTETGRLSSKGPNMQNLPRGPVIKNMFIPTEGYTFLEVDYSQAELRVLAVLSKDPFLREVYLSGRDLHDEVAKALFGEHFTQEQRVRAKAVNFGLAYGRTAYSIADEYNIPVEEAKAIIRDWFIRMPTAARYIQDCRSAPRRGIIIETPFGRRRRFGLITKENAWAIENEAINFPIQSTASDLTLMSACTINQAKKQNRLEEPLDFHIVNLVHDSILFEVKIGQEKQLARFVKSVMETLPLKELETDIPFLVDFKAGNRYGSLKKFKLEEEVAA